MIDTPRRTPDVRQALTWRDWESGTREARERGLPILCLAEPAWSTGSQRLALVLGREGETRDIAEMAFVPILLDPLDRPDVAARLRWAATVLTGTAGPPLLVLLTPSTRPFLAYCSLWPEGREPYPSLGSLLRAVAALGDERRAALEAEADELQARAAADSEGATDGVWPGVAQVLRHAADERFGGLEELPKHPRPALLWRALCEADDPSVSEHVLRTLEVMQRGGILDQIGDGFHRCARDERWVVPHFEKLVPVNAGLAAVYARAAERFERPDFHATARGAATFASAGLDRGMLAVGADADHYTWLPAQVNEVLEPALVQVVGLHFNITNDASRQVLFRALDADALGDHADEPPDVLRERLERGKALLAMVRARRPPPTEHACDAPAWRAESVRWLFAAARHGLASEIGALDRHLSDLLDGPFDRGLGFRRGSRHWLEDQVAILAACVAASRVRPAALARATELAETVLDAYLDPRDGAMYDAPRCELGDAPSQDVVDHALSAAIPTFVGALTWLAAAGEAAGSVVLRARFVTAAATIERRYGSALAAATPGGA